MPIELSPLDPNWIPKNVGDLQTAPEMNEVMSAFKHNANILHQLILILAPQVPLLTTNQLFSTAINEIFNLATAAGGGGKINTPTWIDVENGATHNLPAMTKGQSLAFRIWDEEGQYFLPNGSFWLGGFSGIACGHMAWIIAMENSPGGSFSEVGYRYLIINQRKETLVVTGDVMPDDFPLTGNPGTIYIETSTGLTYYWYQLEGELVAEYVPIGEVIRGKLISATQFNDEDNNPIIPTGIQLYFDIDSELYYRWDGAQFLPINYTTGGGGSIDLSHLLEGNVPRYDPLSGNLENSIITEKSEKVGIGTTSMTEKLEVNGNVKAVKMILVQALTNALPNTFWVNMSGNPMFTNGAGVSKQMANDEQVYKTISGNVTLDDTYHNAIVWITANAIITVPSTLRADFNCVFDAIGSVVGTFTEGAGVTFSAPNGKILKDNEMCSLSKRTSSVYRLNGGLLNE